MKQNKELKKLAALVFAGLFVLLLVSIGQILYNVNTISGYNHVRIPSYGKAVATEVITQTKERLVAGLAYIIISFISILAYILTGIFIKDRNINEKKQGSVVFGVEMFCCVVLLVMVILLLTILPGFKDNLPAFNSAYPDEFGIYDYEFAMQGQSQLMMPIITILSMLIMGVINSFVKRFGNSKPEDPVAVSEQSDISSYNQAQ